MKQITVEASSLDAAVPARTDIERAEIVDSHKSQLTEVLDLAPGINVREGGRGEARLDMRGFDQRGILFTLNGVPVYEPYNGITNLDLFPLELLGSIELTRGPSSSLFGPNGMAGTVKLNTLIPTAPLTGAVSTIWRNSDFWDTRGSAGMASGPTAMLVGGRYLSSRGYPLSADFEDRPASRRRLEDGGVRLNGDRNEGSGFGTLTYKLSDSATGHTAVLVSSDAFGEPPSTTEFLPVFRRITQEQLVHVQSGADAQISPTARLGGAIFYTSYTMDETVYDSPSFASELLTTRADSQELGTIEHLTLDLSERGSLAIATQVRGDWANVSDTQSGPLVNPDFITTSIAAEHTYLLTDRIWLFSGMSFDIQTGGGNTLWEPDPQGGIAVDFGMWGTTRAGIARKIRFPTLRELDDPLQGNPHLQPEKTISYQIGHRVEQPWGYGEVSLFRNDVSDLIDKEGGSDPQRNVNLQDAVLQGVEVATGGLPVTGTRLDVNYTYLDATARNPVTDDFTSVQHKPEHRFNGILQVFLPYASVLRLEGLYASSALDRFASDVTVDGYTLFNAQLTTSIGDHFDVFVGANNLLDTDYEDKLGSPNPGRWEFAGFRARY